METYISYLTGLIALLVDKVTTKDAFYYWCVTPRDASTWEGGWLMVYETILQAVACIR